MKEINKNCAELNLIGSSLSWSYKLGKDVFQDTINLDENILSDGIIRDCSAFNEVVNSIGLPVEDLIINFKSSKIHQENMVVPKLRIFEKNKLVNTFVSAKMINIDDYKVFTTIKNLKKGESLVNISLIPIEIIDIFKDLLSIIEFKVRGLYIWNGD